MKVGLRRASDGGKITQTKEITYWEDDDNPDYLLPSNGGYNPKQKTIFEEESRILNP